MAKETTALTIVDPETGEITTVTDPQWSSAAPSELGSLMKFSDIPREPMAIVQIGWTAGKRQGIEGLECGLIAFFQKRTGKELQGAFTFGESVRKALHNFQAAGKGTANTPVICKPERSGPTAAGYYVDKLVQVTPAEERELIEALLGSSGV